MEQGEGPEIQRTEIQTQDRLRAVQREKILHEYIKEPLEMEFLGALIPKDRPMPQTTTNANHLRQLAKSLGKDTHTVFFGLAATSSNPTEFYNILFNVASLKRIDPSYWNFEKSEDHFLRRPLPEHVDVSEEARIQAEAMVADKDTANDGQVDTQHLMESFLYIVSARNVSLEDKRRILSNFYSARGIMPPPSGSENRQKIYGPDSSFWSHVDGSWIDPKLAPKLAAKVPTGQPKKPSIASDVVSSIKDRLKRPEVAPQAAAPVPAARPPVPEGAIAARVESQPIPETQQLPPGTTAEMLGLPFGADISTIGQRDPDGFIHYLWNCDITLRDGTTRMVGFNSQKQPAVVNLADGSTVPSDQIVSFRNLDSDIDIPVWAPAPKPQDAAPVLDAAAPLDSSRKNLDEGYPGPSTLPTIKELGKGDKPWIEELNDELKNQTTNEVYFDVSPRVLRDYIGSVAQGQLLREGEIEIDKDNDKITVKGARIKLPMIGGTVDLDLVITNRPWEHPWYGRGLEVNIQNLEGGLRGKAARRKIEEGLRNINSAINDRLDQAIKKDNPSWTTKYDSSSWIIKPAGFRILGDKVRIGFNKGEENDALDVPSFLRRNLPRNRGFFR